MKRLQGFEQRARSAADVVAELKSCNKVFVHGAAATPTTLHEVPPAAIGPVESEIGALIAPLVEDGATLQMGIGAPE